MTRFHVQNVAINNSKPIYLAILKRNSSDNILSNDDDTGMTYAFISFS